MNSRSGNKTIALLLGGDLMPGRGIDQVLPFPGEPTLHEPWVKDARVYVELAEAANGPIPRPVAQEYPWGDTLDLTSRLRPALALVNLETAVTTSDDWWPDKGIHYRMHPANSGFLRAAGIDAVTLANNHVLDWGRSGLLETMRVVEAGGLAGIGAGSSREEAEGPLFRTFAGGRVLVFAAGTPDSGIPPEWAATAERPGVFLLDPRAPEAVKRFIRRVKALKSPEDLALLSIHWGGNWGFAVPDLHRRFARHLIDEAGIDLIHGHSSHHVKGVEVYRGRLILYGCGDLLNDYEGIKGYEEYRGDLGLLYLASLDPADGSLKELRMFPTQVKNFRINRPGTSGLHWLTTTLNREGKRFGTRVTIQEDGSLTLHWK